MLLAYPAFLGIRALKLPAISDVTTDTDNPPRFESLRANGRPDRVAYPGAAVAALQHAGYPDIAPLDLMSRPSSPTMPRLRSSPNANGRSSMRAARALGRRDGVIEAVARTLIMGFRDDIVIRVARPVRARASTCARPRASARMTSAPMHRACAACSRISTTR